MKKHADIDRPIIIVVNGVFARELYGSWTKTEM